MKPFVCYSFLADRQRADTIRVGKGSLHLDLLYKESGGNLARASRLLDSRCYAESRCAFLACRALDAFEDLASDEMTARAGIEVTAAFLSGYSETMPALDELLPRCMSDQLEVEMVRRLPDIRDAVASLDTRAKKRVHCLIATVATGMTRALGNGTRPATESYGAAVLGNVCRFAFQVLDIASGSHPDFRSMGILLQAANDLRDAAFDSGDKYTGANEQAAERELHLNLLVAEMAPQCLTSLSQACFPRFSRARGAITFLLLSTGRFFAKRSGIRTPFLFRHCWLAAYSAVASQRSYERALLEAERVFDKCVVYQCYNLGGTGPRIDSLDSQGLRYSRLQSLFEARIASRHPNPEKGRILMHATELVHASLRLSAALRPASLAEIDQKGPMSTILMVSDYLIACAIAMLSDLGSEILEEAGASISALARAAEEHTARGDYHGELARFLSAVVAKALGYSAEDAFQWTFQNQATAATLCTLDHDHSLGLSLLPRRVAMKRTSLQLSLNSIVA